MLSELTLPIALHNYNILKGLPEYTRIRVTDGVMSYEERYFMSARRYMDQSSRNQLIQPLKQTFVLIQNIIKKDELCQTLEHVSNILEMIYCREGSGSELFSVIDDLINSLSAIPEQSLSSVISSPPAVSPPTMSPIVSPPTMSPTVSPTSPQAPSPPSRLSDQKEMAKFQEAFERYYESQRQAPSTPITMANDFDSLPEVAVVRRRRPDDIRIQIPTDEPEDVEPNTNRCILFTNFIKWLRDVF